MYASLPICSEFSSLFPIIKLYSRSSHIMYYIQFDTQLVSFKNSLHPISVGLAVLLSVIERRANTLHGGRWLFGRWLVIFHFVLLFCFVALLRRFRSEIWCKNNIKEKTDNFLCNLFFPKIKNYSFILLLFM